MGARPRFDDFPDYIDLVPNANGGYSPDFTIPQRPPPAPIEVYRPPEDIPLYEPPVPPPTATPRRPFNDADAAEFGTDRYGRPIVTRRPDGSYGVNPENGFTPQEMADADDYINGRQPRTPAGGRSSSAARNVGRVVDALENATGAFGATGAAADAIANAINGPGSAIDNAIRDRFGLPRRGPDGNPLPNGPGGEMVQPGAGEYPQGQCDAPYSIHFNVDRYYQGNLVAPQEEVTAPGIVQGPILAVYYASSAPNAPMQLYVQTNVSEPFQLGRNSSTVNTWANITNLRLTRIDGLPDNCGQPLPGPAPTNPPTTNPDASPQPYPQPYPYPYPYPLPAPSPSPLPSPQPYPDGSNPFPLPDSDGDGIPDLLDPYPNDPFPYPPGLPEPSPDEPPDAPTPNDDCCPATTLSLDRILQKLEGNGKGIFDLAPCESEIDPQNPPNPLAGLYEGEGLAGLYAAIAQLTKSLNLVRADTKCPPDVNAALPMFWEMKVGEVPQLVIIWRKITPPGEPVSGSTWSMTIPHPRADIGPDYEFSFPSYMKGGNMASMRLSDNSQCIVNAVSEPEAQKVLDYVTTLIDPAFIPDEGPKVVYSKGVAEYAEVDVKAVYVKKFAGHKTTAPLWGHHIA